MNTAESYRKCAISYFLGKGIYPSHNRIMRAVEIIICNRNIADTPEGVLEKFYKRGEK